MGQNIDYTREDVRADTLYWGEWIGRETGISGIRFDAVKHFSENFLRDFIRHLDQTVGRDWFLVGEYWRNDLRRLSNYIERMGHRMSLMDVPLVGNMTDASRQEGADLRRLMEGTLAQRKPGNAVVGHPLQQRRCSQRR